MFTTNYINRLLTMVMAVCLIAGAPMNTFADNDFPTRSHKSKKKAGKKRVKATSEVPTEEQAKLVQHINQLKKISGKPDQKAELYVIIFMTSHYIFNCSTDAEGVLHELKDGETVKILSKIQKAKGVETLLLVEEGSDMKALKKKAMKLLKLRCPVLLNTPGALGTLAFDADGIMLATRDGEMLVDGYMPVVAEKILEEIEERQ